MDVWKEHIERFQDSLIENFRNMALQIAEKYTPHYVDNLKIELNLDKPKKKVIINILTFNI
jgi:septum formation topological specificity factor MinE